jgi:hypothetical protein
MASNHQFYEDDLSSLIVDDFVESSTVDQSAILYEFQTSFVSTKENKCNDEVNNILAEIISGYETSSNQELLQQNESKCLFVNKYAKFVYNLSVIRVKLSVIRVKFECNSIEIECNSSEIWV